MNEVTRTVYVQLVIHYTSEVSGKRQHIDRLPGSGKLISVSREISVDDKEVYRDLMSPDIYKASSDPIRNFERFLIGIEKEDGGNDIDSNNEYPESFFDKIRRKLFGRRVKERIYFNYESE